MGELQSLKEELAHWQCIVKKADDEKTQLLLKKLDADQMRSDAQEEVKKLMEEEQENNKKNAQKKADHQGQMNKLNEQNSQLQREIARLEKNLAAVVTDLKERSEEMKFQKDLPLKKVKFTHMEDIEYGNSENERFMNIQCQFCITSNISLELKGGQALLTLEEEEVAQKLIKKHRHVVNLDTEKLEVRSVPVPLETGLKFEIHVTISQKEVCVSQLPDYLPEESLRDQLELYFYKSSVGGGEIANVQLDKQSKTAIITFLEPGVAQRVVKRRKHTLMKNSHAHEVTVAPQTKTDLKKLQTYSGVAKRTILLTEMRNIYGNEESIQDMIEIFFQKPSNGGGEVQCIKYLSDGSVTACFEEDVEKAE